MIIQLLSGGPLSRPPCRCARPQQLPPLFPAKLRPCATAFDPRRNAGHIRVMPQPPRSPSDKKPRASRGKASKPAAPPVETAARTPGFGEAPQSAFTAAGPLGAAPPLYTLPA
jgi:hypothetical protein